MCSSDLKAFRNTFFCNQRGFIMGISRGDFIKRQKAQGGFKDDVFSEEMHSLKAQKPLAPCFLVKINRGANSGSTWGWLLLEGVKNSEHDLWCMPDAWYLTHPFSLLDQLPKIVKTSNHQKNSPEQLPTHPTILAFFLRGCI